jgi:hypothetical protein
MNSMKNSRERIFFEGLGGLGAGTNHLSVTYFSIKSFSGLKALLYRRKGE